MGSDADLHDVIGFWTELKLEIIEKYLPAYTTILSKQNARFRFLYIDAFAGSGTHVSKSKREEVAGSPARALAVQPPFQEFHFIDIEDRKVQALERLAAERENVTVHRGDCNRILLDRVFPRCRYEDFARAVCLLDPYGLQLDWNVIETAGKLGTIEIFLNFPIMDINRNALARDASKERPKHVALTRFWGDESWRDAGYESQPTLFGTETVKKTNVQFVNAFRDRLRKVAGFKFVAEPLAMRNQNRAVVYYLFFASPNRTGSKIVAEIFQRYREKGYG
jgi:three-Cys-motif partner protein